MACMAPDLWRAGSLGEDERVRARLKRLVQWFRRRSSSSPAPARDWSALALERLPWLKELDGPERVRALAHLHAVANGVPFVGVDGFDITDEMIVVIAGAAARLVRNLPPGAYENLTRIVVTPSHLETSDGTGVVFGLASNRGEVTLSWNAVRHGIGNPLDGHDTALHEFAHILDVGDGIFDGIPPSHVDDHHGFAHALAAGFVRFQELADKGLARRFVMRDYGATNAAEFFAVATEAFFEKPRQLQQKKPEVYRALARFYRIDPLARPGRHGRHRHGRRHRP
jgi:Mlc titration factor MtfA (ptsG expression regulator)